MPYKTVIPILMVFSGILKKNINLKIKDLKDVKTLKFMNATLVCLEKLKMIHKYFLLITLLKMFYLELIN